MVEDVVRYEAAVSLADEGILTIVVLGAGGGGAKLGGVGGHEGGAEGEDDGAGGVEDGGYGLEVFGC